MGKKKYYLTVDTETATLPFANKVCQTAEQKKKVAIAKPLVYDIGWVITDRQGTIIKKENFLIQETFFVPNIFNTAYYQEKRPIYMDLLKKGEIDTGTWNEVMEKFLEDLRTVDLSAAYNAAFDFKKAIPFTEQYINALYGVNGEDYNAWERRQFVQCRNIAKGITREGTRPDFLTPIFEFRGEQFPIADLWNLACVKLININKYRNFCLERGLLTASAKFFKSSAETTFQYLMGQYDFIEDHTALSDAMIEAAVLTKGLKRGAVLPQLEAFPFRNLGTTFDYVQEQKPKYIPAVVAALETYLKENDGWVKAEMAQRYWISMVNIFNVLSETGAP